MAPVASSEAAKSKRANLVLKWPWPNLSMRVRRGMISVSRVRGMGRKAMHAR